MIRSLGIAIEYYLWINSKLAEIWLLLTGSSLIYKLITLLGLNIFPIIRITKLVKLVVNITKSTSPIVVGGNIILNGINYCPSSSSINIKMYTASMFFSNCP